ncbi:MAG: hypothetical protein IT367_07675 [Candidatus Hydrogenedentes bacterium]|nr:hypothetical protein [Candidatus Hydrogenedentota bacterium]
MMDGLKQLIAYTNWGNRLWLDFVHANAPNDDYLTKMISHIYCAERIWFQRIHEEPLDTGIFETLPKAELEAIADRTETRYAEALKADLAQVFHYRKLNGEPMASTLLDILHHLITHGSHHRGQMARHVSQAGITPPESSYIGFSRLQK